jgi:hypothetical protein
MRVIAVTAGQADDIEWAVRQAEAAWGELALRSPVFAFDQTRFYEPEMGPNLSKQLFAFGHLMDPAELAAAKLLANDWEREAAAEFSRGVARPVNVDPGYLTEAKLVLASTKDRDHRIYLGQGIYGEVTLYFHDRQWRGSRWTYPDYQQSAFVDFFTQVRELLRRRLAEATG